MIVIVIIIIIIIIIIMLKKPGAPSCATSLFCRAASDAQFKYIK
jgi:hypothetical protein